MENENMEKITMIWINAIEKSMDNDDYNLEEAMKFIPGENDDEYLETFYGTAHVICEPVFNYNNKEEMKASEEYESFMDKNIDNWVGFIKSSFGDDWGAIAEKIKEFGY